MCLTKVSKSLFLTFVLFFVFPPSIYATTQVSIDSFQNTIVAEQGFDVYFSATGLDSGASYYVKALGGNNFTEADTWNNNTSNWLQQNASWTNMPDFTANNEGSASATIKTRFEKEAVGSKEFKLRIRKINVTPNIDSDVVIISVSAASPDPTSTPTESPTDTPSPTPIPTSTQTPTPRPTVKAAATKRPIKLTFDTDDSEDSILGLREGLAPSPTGTPEPEVGRKFPWSSLFFILGGIGFMGFAGFSFLKQRQKGYNDENGDEKKTKGFEKINQDY